MRQICRLLNLCRSTQRHLIIKDDREVEEKLLQLAKRYPTRGMDWYYLKIRQEGLKWNRKKIIRVYRKLNLKMRKKHKKRINRPYTEVLCQPLFSNVTWSMDFMSDSFEDGRTVRILNIIDDYNRECLSIDAGISIGSNRVTRILDWIIERRGKPIQIRTDNGPEFTSHHYVDWCEQNQIQPKYIQPGKPNQNGFVERFNRTYREDVLDAYLFADIHQLQIITDKWKQDYNNGHPHQAFQGRSPIQFKLSRSKVIEAYEKVKAKMNGSDEPALTISSPSICWSLRDNLMG
jgi:putative transposase